MRLRRQDDEEPVVDMAPLIDCVFLLLIFFLVSTTLKKTEPELPLQLPESGASIETPMLEGRLIIGIDAEGQKYFGGEPITSEILHAELKSRAAQDPGQAVRVDADKAVVYEDLVEVIEMCQFYGLRNLGLHTRPSTEAIKTLENATRK